MFPFTNDIRYTERCKTNPMSAWRVVSDRLPYYSGIVCGFGRSVIIASVVWSQAIPRTMTLNNIQDRDVNLFFLHPHITERCLMRSIKEMAHN